MLDLIESTKRTFCGSGNLISDNDSLVSNWRSFGLIHKLVVTRYLSYTHTDNGDKRYPIKGTFTLVPTPPAKEKRKEP